MGRGHPRIAASELNLDRSLRPRDRLVVERRAGHTDEWTTVGRFDAASEAARRIDEEVGLGHGAPADYRVRVSSPRWVRPAALAAFVVVGIFVAIAVVLIWT